MANIKKSCILVPLGILPRRVEPRMLKSIRFPLPPLLEILHMPLIQFIHRRPNAKLGDIVLAPCEESDAADVLREHIAAQFDPDVLVSEGVEEAIEDENYVKAFRLAREEYGDIESDEDTLEVIPA